MEMAVRLGQSYTAWIEEAEGASIEINRYFFAYQPAWLDTDCDVTGRKGGGVQTK